MTEQTPSDSVPERFSAGRSHDVLIDMVRISTEHGDDHDAAIHGLLEAVRAFLDLPVAIVSRIVADDYVVEQVIDRDGELVSGVRLSVAETYCERVIALETPLFVERASDSLFKGHPCYEEKGLETYIGVRLMIGDQLYGTLNLTSPEPRSRPFTRDETSVVETAGAMISQHIALRQADQRFQLAVEGASVGLWDWNIRTGETYWSPRVYELTGVSPSGKNRDFDAFIKRLHEDDQPRVVATVERHLKYREPYDVECRLLRADGSYIWIHARGQAIWDEDGDPIRMAGSVNDINDRKQAEIRERNRLHLMELAGHMAKLGYFSFDTSTGEMNCSGEVFEIYGLEPDADGLLDAFMEKSVHPDDREHVAGFIKAAEETGEPQSLTRRIIRADNGEVRLVDSKLRRVPGDVEGGWRYFGVMQDVTEQRAAELRLRHQAEALKRSNAELESFAYIASHDLQEPLRKIAAFGERLEAGYGNALDERGRRFIQVMVDGAARMRTLIEDLLDYSRASNVTMQFAEIDLAELVADAASEFDLAAAECAAEISCDCDAKITADRKLLRQVMTNLIGNALKYRREDVAPQICVAIETVEDADSWRVSVADNGIGFRPEFAARIFDMFKRLHSRDAYPGTGLGLALCSRIVERHGGRIWAEGTPGEGAVFHIDLPKRPTDRYSLMTGAQD